MDGLAELLALLAVLDSLVQRALGDTHRLSGDADTAAVQRAHGDLKSLAHRSQHTIRGHADVIIGDDAVAGGADTHTLDILADGDAGGVLQIHDKGGQTLGGRHRAVSQSKDDAHIGKAGVGGEDLGAVQDPVLAVLHGHGLGALYVGAGVGLRQAEGADLAAVHQRTQELLLLLLGAVVVDAGAAQGGVHGNSDTGRGIHLGDLLHAQGIGQRVGAGAPYWRL